MAARSSAAARRRPDSRARKKKAGPRVQQHHLDLLALALVALAVLMAFVAWLEWDGGAAGRALLDGTRWLVGSMYVVLPVVLMGAAVLIVLRPALPAGKPLRLGGVLLFLGMALALRDGGVVGDALERGTETALGAAGPGIVAVFLLAAAALLLTGASVASILTATGSRVSSTSRRVRETTAEARTAVTRLRPARPEAPERPEPSAASRRKAPPGAVPASLREEAPDEPFAAEEPGEAAFGFEAPAPAQEDDAPEPDDAPAPGRDGFWSGSERFPDFFGGEAPGSRELEPEPEPDDEPVAEALAYEAPEAPEAFEPAPDLDPEPVADEPRLAEDPETDEPGVLRSTAASPPGSSSAPSCWPRGSRWRAPGSTTGCCMSTCSGRSRRCGSGPSRSMAAGAAMALRREVRRTGRAPAALRHERSAGRHCPLSRGVPAGAEPRHGRRCAWMPGWGHAERRECDEERSVFQRFGRCEPGCPRPP